MAKRLTVGEVDYTKSTPYLISQEPKEQQRAEYTALRDVIQKRLARIDESTTTKRADPYNAFDPRNYEFYKYWKKYKGRVPELSELSDNKLTYILADMKKQIVKPVYNKDGKQVGQGWETSSISGVRRNVAKRIKGLNEAGYKGINKQNFVPFTKFMEKYRDNKYDNVIGSPQAIDLFVRTNDKGLRVNEVMNAFMDFMANEWQLQDFTASEIRYNLRQAKAGKRGAQWVKP